MHVTNGVRDQAASFPFPSTTDDRSERRQANRAVAIGALGLAITGLIELAIAALSGSVALLGDALRNLSDVSSQRPGIRRIPRVTAPRHRLLLVWVRTRRGPRRHRRRLGDLGERHRGRR